MHYCGGSTTYSRIDSRLRSSNTIHGNPPCAPSTPAPIQNAETIRATAWNLIATAKARSLLKLVAIKEVKGLSWQRDIGMVSEMALH